MAKNLLIIESPNKIETIKKYLKGMDFEIIATVGHIRDLTSRGMGFNERTIEPYWIVPTKKPKGKNDRPKHEIIFDIKEAANKAEKIYLATDPDREGEAIAWHVYEILPKAEQEKCLRITFNEITKDAIFEALEKPRKIDLLWVQSQFARRIIDRLVGYKLSKLIKKKLKAKSAGRVQTVALKFIYDREKEIEKFKSTKWWTVDAILDGNITLILREVNPNIKDLNYKKINDDVHGTGIDFKDEESATLVKNNLNPDNFKVYAIDDPKIITSNPKDPYKTSTMQQDAINKLGWNVQRVSIVSQSLYEGVKFKNGETVALISYPRTDSVRVSDYFAKKVSKYIIENFGEKYYFEREFKNSKKAEQNVQDAHEAIRVIDPFIKPESIKKFVTVDQYKLYKLIWCRTIAAFMAPTKYENTIVRLINNKNKFYTYNRKIVFDGYRKVYSEAGNEIATNKLSLSRIKIGKVFKAKEINVTEHESQPPARYTQATLIKALDEAGVGRPSTYRTMADMAVKRGYAALENRSYHILPIGCNVIEELQTFFPYIVDVQFTKDMEEHLDLIAEKEENWKEWIKDDFSPKFNKDLKKAKEKMKNAKPEKVGRKCPKCNRDLIYRYSRKNGKQFIGCSGFPECKYCEFPNSPIIELDRKCPKCGHNLIERTSRWNRRFIGCSNYPKCHYIENIPQPKKEDEKKNLNIKPDEPTELNNIKVEKDSQVKKTKK